MDYISLVSIAIGLAMDAFAVSVSSGASYKNCKLTDSFKVALAFGLFQGLMPIIGWTCGIAFSSVIMSVDHFIAFALLGYLGFNMIKEALKKQNDDINPKYNFLKMSTLLTMAVATSIDALATGVILPNAIGANTSKLMIIAVLIIGLITFIISFMGVNIGKKFGTLLKSKAELLGGVVLIAIGSKILIEHLFFS